MFVTYPRSYPLRATRPESNRIRRLAEGLPLRAHLRPPGSACVNEGTDTMSPEAEQAIAHPIDEPAVVEEQIHRRQETHEGREQPQEAEALLHAIPCAENHR